MLTESTLSYLGFGIPLPTPTWGNLLNGANNSIVIQQYWWQWVFPVSYTHLDGSKTFTVTINEGLTYNNGEEIKAADYIWAEVFSCSKVCLLYTSLCQRRRQRHGRRGA